MRPEGLSTQPTTSSRRLILAPPPRLLAVLLAGVLLAASPAGAKAVSGTAYVPVRVGSSSGEEKRVPVPNLTVWLKNDPPGPWESEHVVTDAHGRFQFIKPDPGAYRVHYSASGFNTTCESFQFTVADASVPLGWVDVRPLKQALAGRVSMGAYPAFRADSFYGLLAAATVRLKLGGVDVVPPVTVSTDGQYLLGNIPAGTYSLEASLEGTLASQNVTVPAGGSDGCSDTYTVVPEYTTLTLPNSPPRVKSVIAWDGASKPRTDVAPSSTVTVEATVADTDLDYIHYSWKLGTDGFGQVLTPIQVPPRPPGMDTPKLTWQVPSVAGSFVLHLQVSDSRGGYAWSQVSLTTDGTGALFTGVVSGSDGPVLSGATVVIDGDTTTQTNSLGYFSAFRPDNSTRHVQMTSATSYTPHVSLHQTRRVGAKIKLPRESVFVVDPTQPIDVTEDFSGTPGARIVIGANQIVNGAGIPATSPVNLYVTSYDVLNTDKPLPGDSVGLSPAGVESALTPLGAVRLRIADSSGNRHHLASGVTAMAQVPVSASLIVDPTQVPRTGLQGYLVDGGTGEWGEQLPATGELKLPGDPPPPNPPSFPPPYIIANIKLGPELVPPPVFPDPPIQIARPLPARACMTINFDPAKIPSGRYFLLVTYFERGVKVSRPPQVLVPPQVQVSSLPPDTAITLDVTNGDDPIVLAHQVVNSGPAVSCPEEGFACLCNSEAFILIAPDVDIQSKFLTRAQNAPGDGATYYALVDPSGLRSTLAGFKSANRFGTAVTPPSIEVSDAIYFNQGDLQFGRKMSGRYNDTIGTSAFYVTNYPSADEAALNLGKIATVAMEFSFTTGFSPDRFVKFYVYNANDVRVTSANLDGFVREVPGLCVACHSLDRYSPGFPATADTSSRFLPFDLDAFEYAQLPGFTRAEQETKFHDLNRIITAGAHTAKRSEATRGLIEDTWYPTGPPQQSSAVVPGWSVADNCDAPLSQFQVGNVYLNAFKTSCRTCHVARDPNLDWADYTRIVETIDPPCVPAPARNVRNMHFNVCVDKGMPHSKVTYVNLWTTPSRHQALFQWFKDQGIPASTVDDTCK